MKGLAAALCGALLALSQDQQQPPPRTTFTSTVDLVPVDVNVIDKSGRPVSDLAPGDFTLAIDGSPAGLRPRSSSPSSAPSRRRRRSRSSTARTRERPAAA